LDCRSWYEGCGEKCILHPLSRATHTTRQILQNKNIGKIRGMLGLPRPEVRAIKFGWRRERTWARTFSTSAELRENGSRNQGSLWRGSGQLSSSRSPPLRDDTKAPGPRLSAATSDLRGTFMRPTWLPVRLPPPALTLKSLENFFERKDRYR